MRERSLGIGSVALGPGRAWYEGVWSYSLWILLGGLLMIYCAYASGGVFTAVQTFVACEGDFQCKNLEQAIGCVTVEAS